MPKDLFFWGFLHFLWTIWKTMVQMAGMTIHVKWSIFPKILTVLWCNHYLSTLKWFLHKFQSKLSHTCSLNWNYFRKIDIKSFKCAKLVRKWQNFLIFMDYPSNMDYFVWKLDGCHLATYFCTYFTKSQFWHLENRKWYL